MSSVNMIKVRSAAVLVEGDEVLLGRHQGHDFLVPIGGSVEFSEDLRQACRREVQEETGLSVLVKELLHVGELLNSGQHVLDTLFYCQLDSKTKDVAKPGDATLLEITWLPLDRLNSVRIEPHEFWDVFRRNPWQELDRLRASPQYVGRYLR